MKYSLNAFNRQATSTSSFNVPDHAEQLQHRVPENVRDKLAYQFVKFLRFFADSFFARSYGHRSVVLERIAMSIINSPTS
jgi:hypothetical protein